MAAISESIDLAATVLQSGVHKGKRFDQVPAFFLEWLAGVQWMPVRFPEIHGRLVAYLELPDVRDKVVTARSKSNVVRVPGPAGQRPPLQG